MKKSDDKLGQGDREVFKIADDFLEKVNILNPLEASEEGFSDFDSEVGDLSPLAYDDTAQLAKSTIKKLKDTPPKDDHEQLCADVLTDYCADIIDEYDTLDYLRGTSFIDNPLDLIHVSSLNIDFSSKHARENLSLKITKIPSALKTYKETLLYAKHKKALPRARQIERMIGSCDVYATEPLFQNSVAPAAFLDFKNFLRNEILNATNPVDAVGIEHYQRSAKRHLGKDIDVYETFLWGFEEVRTILREADTVAAKITPGEGYLAAVNFLESDPEYTLNSPAELRSFLRILIEEALEDLDGKHFDIDPRLKNIEAATIEESGTFSMFYVPSSDDFSRGARTYYPLNGKTKFSTWAEATTCFHESIPGHHLHLGSIKCLGDDLSHFQKTLACNNGMAEGWALYAERLMVELNLMRDPGYVLGMYAASLFRALRVVIDIGLQCGYQIPNDAPLIFERGSFFNRKMAVDLLVKYARETPAYCEDEVDRYLGWIGQAISYKVGEKTIREIREDERERLQGWFSLKDFHSRILSYGHVGLGRLEQLFAKPIL